MHNQSEEHMGKLGSLVIVDSSKKANLKNIADAIAMHITAMRPTYLTKACVPSDIKADDREILEKQELISAENPDNLTVEKFIEKKSKELDTKISIHKFMLFSLA